MYLSNQILHLSRISESVCMIWMLSKLFVVTFKLLVECVILVVVKVKVDEKTFWTRA